MRCVGPTRFEEQKSTADFVRIVGQYGMAILAVEFPRLVRPLGINWNRQRPLAPNSKLLMQCLEEVAGPKGTA